MRTEFSLERGNVVAPRAEILIAEDEPTARRGFRVLFEGEGYAVRTARDGEEALANEKKTELEVEIRANAESETLARERDRIHLRRSLHTHRRIEAAYR